MAAILQPYKRIVGIQFYVPSAESIVASSVCGVTSATVYERNLPKPDGVNDTRMGTVDRRLRCGTCRQDLATCQGHHGHLALAAPMYHPYFVEHVYKTLRMVCYFCSALLTNTAVPVAGGKEHFKSLAKRTSRPTRCCTAVHDTPDGPKPCGAPQPQWSRTKTKISVSWSEAALKKLDELGHSEMASLTFTPFHAWLILRRISDADATTLGFDVRHTRLENLILRTLVVPPPCIRPSIMATTGSRNMGMDDVTILLNDIVKANIVLNVMMEADSADDDIVGYLLKPTPAFVEAANKLQEAIDVYIREDPSSVQNGRHSHGNSKRRNLAQRLKGKEGRVRANLSGKRVDYSARTVISPDAELDIDQFGVPEHVAQTLTIRETVFPLNKEAMWAAILAGPKARGGARSIIYKDGTMVRLDTCTMRERLHLNDGDVVERTLRDGDMMVFNRQPTLHKLSMLGFRAKIMPGKTFRLPVPVTTGFNADYDGDELNAHVPQDIHSMVEIKDLMGVAVNMVTPQNSQVITSLKQDSLLGMFLITLPGVVIPYDRACQLSMALRYPKKTLTRRPLVGGKVVFSLMISPTMNFGASGCKIVDGQMMECDCLTKGIVRSLIHYYWLKDPDCAAQFVSDMQRLSNAYLRMRGMSVGVVDCLPPRVAAAHIVKMNSEVERLYSGVVNEGRSAGIGDTALEPILSGVLSSALNYAGQVCQDKLAVHGSNAAASNNVLAMVKSGSKGSMMNIGQIMGVVGQQYVRGGRIKGRLSCFPPSDHSKEAHGYVGRSYLQGLRPSQYFHHAMGGREGLVDTSVRTADCGYLQRKLMKGMESARVAYDGTVRNSMQEVLQFTYGGDGFDATHLVKTSLPLVCMTDEQVAECAVNDDEAVLLIQYRDVVREAVPVDPWRPTRRDVVYMPFHGPWLLDEMNVKLEGREEEGGTEWCVAWMVRLLPRLPEHPLVKAYVAWYFRGRVMAKYTHKAAKRLADVIVGKVGKATVAPSEMVGGLAAQSCGEPTTQLTLNTFHSSGVQHDVSQGVPRLKELLNVTLKSKPKTPVMTVTLQAPECYDRDAVTATAHALPVVVFHTLVKSTMIQEAALDELDSLHARVFHDLDVAVQRRTLIPLTIMFHLDSKALSVCGGAQDLAVRMADFVRKLLVDTTMVCHVIATPKGCPPQIRLRFSDTTSNKRKRSAQKALDARLTNIQHRVLNLEVSGVNEIESTQVTRKEYDGQPPKYEILCRGVNIAGVLHAQPSLDRMSVVCNDVVAILRLYGLEAAAKALFYEIKSVLSGDSSTLHDRHIMMIVDTMTRGGHLMPMNRYGLNKRHTGPLVRSSFEQTVDVFNEAAVFSERDTMAGVSENVMAGQLAPLGTGCIDVLNPADGQWQRDDAGDDDVVMSKLGDHLDPAAVQYEPCLPHVGPDLHADVPSLPCGDFVLEHDGMEFTSQTKSRPMAHPSPAFEYAPRSPLVHREGLFLYAPRSP